MTDESYKLSDLPPATRLLGGHFGAHRWFYADAEDAHGEGVYSAGEVVAYTQREVQRAVAAERERCAKIVETMDTTGHVGYIETRNDLCEALAFCIRSPSRPA